MSCLGDVAAALVDGELGAEARDRALTHLAGCGRCRTEVIAQRGLKSSLAGQFEPSPQDALTARLLAVQRFTRQAQPILAVDGDAGFAVARPAVRPVPARLGPSRRGAAMSTAVVVSLGTAAVFVLGTPREDEPTTRIDPGSTTLVTDVVDRTDQPMVVNVPLRSRHDR